MQETGRGRKKGKALEGSKVLKAYGCRDFNPGNGLGVIRNREEKRLPFHRQKDFRATFGFSLRVPSYGSDHWE